MTKEKLIWHDIRERCHNPNDTSYELNGAKGVFMADEWRESFEAFLSDMGKKPFTGAVMGRIDKKLGFNKGNCKWMTKEEAQLNKTNMVLNWEIVNEARNLYKNTDLTVKQISEKLGITSISSIGSAIAGKTWKDPNYEYIKRQTGGKSCIVHGCDRKYHSKGYCAMHKTRLVEHGDALWEPPEKIKKCVIKECTAKHFAKGYCRSHYEQKRRNGEIIKNLKYINRKMCSIDGCDEPAKSKGMCQSHYDNMRRNGDPLYQKVNIREIPEYGVWDAMIQRCTNRNNSNYHRYGGRGIEVCERWRSSFVLFYEDMGKRPFEGAELDRKNNSKGYTKDNCRWTTRPRNVQNRDCCVLTEEIVIKIRALRNSGHTYKSISNALGISYENVRSVLSRGSWK